jgi:hypothetical protein
MTPFATSVLSSPLNPKDDDQSTSRHAQEQAGISVRHGSVSLRHLPGSRRSHDATKARADGLAAVATLSYRLQDASAAGVPADTGFGLLALSGIPTAVSLGAYAAFVLKTRCLPRWTAAVALPAALAHVFIAMSLLSHGALLSVEGSVIVWVPALLFAWLAVSCALLRVSVTLPAPDAALASA